MGRQLSEWDSPQAHGRTVWVFFSLEGVTLLGQFRKLSLSAYLVPVLAAQEGSSHRARVQETADLPGTRRVGLGATPFLSRALGCLLALSLSLCPACH